MIRGAGSEGIVVGMMRDGLLVAAAPDDSEFNEMIRDHGVPWEVIGRAHNHSRPTRRARPAHRNSLPHGL